LVVTMLDRGPCVVDGVTVIPAWDPHRGARFVRAVTYRYPCLYRVLRAQGADVYYSRGAGFYTSFVVRAARDEGAVSMLALASDRDLHPSARSALFAVGGSRWSPVVAWAAYVVYRYWALPAASLVAVQNREQAEACHRLGLRHVPLPNIVLSPPEDLAAITPDRDVMWAGNVREGRRSKGLDELAELARLLGDIGFTVVGNLSGESHRRAIDALGRLPNVRLTGPLAHDETQREIAAHRIVINTSPSEGFSNVMLEGWALGRPTVTLSVNPSGLLTHGRLGVCAGGDLQRLAAGIRGLLADPETCGAIGARARDYIRAVHAPERVCAAFERAAMG
jgi:glycosyltransferase involved in cell wall biosynthesis